LRPEAAPSRPVDGAACEYMCERIVASAENWVGETVMRIFARRLGVCSSKLPMVCNLRPALTTRRAEAASEGVPGC